MKNLASVVSYFIAVVFLILILKSFGINDIGIILSVMVGSFCAVIGNMKQ